MEDRRRRVYGRRLTHRLRPGRQALLERALPGLRITLPEGEQARIDLNGLFPAPVDDLWLEIGFGAGEHLAHQVRTNPAVGFVGCEPFVQGIAGLLRHLEDDGTAARVRIFPDDARLLVDRLPDASVGAPVRPVSRPLAQEASSQTPPDRCRDPDRLRAHPEGRRRVQMGVRRYGLCGVDARASRGERQVCPCRR